MKTWFITGASRGLGLEIARAALEAGNQVVATARRPEKVLAGLPDFGERLLALPLDVTEPVSIQAAVDEAVRHFGRVDVLVNNAGYGQLGPFEQISVAGNERQFATNVFGVFAVTRAVLPVMRLQRSGHVLSVSSIAGLVGFGGSSLYCATKFAIEAWSESLHQELAPFGIKTTLVEPGKFRTDFLDASSVSYGDITIADYADYAASQKQNLDDFSHRQAGDPVKLGKAVVALVNSKEPPVRFAAGAEAYEVVMQRAKSLREEADAWRELTLSLDFEEALA